jgi:hypothetical protein
MGFPTTLGPQFPAWALSPGQTVQGYLAFIQASGFKTARITLNMTGPAAERINEAWTD